MEGDKTKRETQIKREQTSCGYVITVRSESAVLLNHMKNLSMPLTTILASVILFSSVPLLYAWTSPSATPPAGNVAAPINIGSASQNKLGALGLGGLAVFGKSLFTETNGYTLPTTKPTMLLGVNGAIGAKEYCDEKGMNCVSTLGGTGGSVGSSAATLSGGQPIVCGGWDVKYGSSGAINAWGCATPASSPVCPGGYDTIKTSKVTINLAEQTNLCVLHSSGRESSGDQIFSGWPNGIVCNSSTGKKQVLHVSGYYPQGWQRYSDKPGYIYGDIGSIMSIYFDASTKKSLIVQGNGDLGANLPGEFAPCFQLGKTISDPAFTWIN
jgi:hypothetical protein